MDKVYHLDLQTLLEFLQGQAALLITQVTVPGRRAPSTGYLFFKNATIIGCLIQTADNAIWQEGEQAYQLLKDNEEWRVRMDLDIEQTYRHMKQQSGGFQQLPPAPPQPAPPAYAPRPLMPLTNALLLPFSAKQRLILRMVFMLVDGQRTPAHIKAQLRLPSEIVDEALRSLYALGVIE